MHDPMVVLCEIRRPWPTRSTAYDSPKRPRWEWRRHGPWWKPSSWSPFLTAFGRGWYFPSLVTVWHEEPGGKDSGTVCGRSDRWKHVHHWKVQIQPVLSLLRRFERCKECGRRMNKARRIGTGWHSKGVVHEECSSLVHLRGQRRDADVLIDRLFAAWRTAADMSTDEAFSALRGQDYEAQVMREVLRLEGRHENPEGVKPS